MVCISIITRRASKVIVASLAPLIGLLPMSALAQTNHCRGKIFLTFDTGSMSQAQLIADTLRQHAIRASFFLANEKTIRGDYSLDPSWDAYWRGLQADGHAFGTHTLDHLRWVRDLPNGAMQVKAQFGPQAGQLKTINAAQYCQQLRAVAQRFLQMTGKPLDPIWRAPAGAISKNSLQAAKQCGYTHFGWASAGFSGDELPSERFPNAQLLQNMLNGLKDGDIVMAHLGIWSRKQPWAPEVLPALIRGLQKKGFCFATLREHPSYPSSARSQP